MRINYAKGQKVQPQKYLSSQQSSQPKKIMLIFPPVWYPSEPYFTVKEGLGIEDAERVLGEFERNHYKGWDLRVYIREYVFLYVAHYGTIKLPFLQFRV
ncbi:MAG: hypothetical protein A2106_02110 [Planctomycetes bacterium GWF2_40_8]|nr:MAG: hypothetical protein A2106_02110 [Planctomycetes bacterium GWF2_40_8]OHB86478.1 MAG: hypothetical protein A3D13_09670 [Planctomycetes bacterium RIFCSPHIGHO2_02_FULL_40_12]OHC01637.1 MAG: hypothetical protein A3H23_09440 [Planctomycetes bacterium RIFCSPLOWO2_12_FULL_40_19]